VASLSPPLAVRERSRFIGVAAAGPAVLLVGHLLPPSGPGLALRLAGAAACVLLLPGALVLRAVAWPASPALAATASFAFSLVVMALALALVFVVGGSIVFAGLVLAVVSACALVPALRRGESTPEPLADRHALAAVLGASVALAGAVWWAAGPLVGDTYFHLGRVQKLAAFDQLSTLSTVNEFQDGGLHPGYVFPLLHGADALIARLAGAEVLDTVVYLPAVLVPLAMVLAYAAGSAVFRSRAGGLALVAVQAAHFGFVRRDDIGLFESLSQPQAASLLLLTPAILALAFWFMAEGGAVPLAALGAAAFSLSAVHPTYTPYVALVFAGFLLARVVFVRGWESVLTRAAVALGAILVPFGLFLALVVPVARDARGLNPSTVQRAAELDAYNAFTTLGDWFSFSPSAIARAGPVLVAGLLAVPLAGFAARRLWASLVLGGSLAVLTVLLTPPLFTAISDAFSVSQSRRLPQFIPVAFAVAGACIVLSRLKAVGIAVAAATGLALAFVYPGEFSYRVNEGGPGWAVAVAVGGGLLALAAGAFLQSWGPPPGGWAVVTAVVFAASVAVFGLSWLQRTNTMTELTPGVVAAVRDRAAPGDVVFSSPEAAYLISGLAPVYVNVSGPGHSANTTRNRPKARLADAQRFILSRSLTDAERRAILGRYRADWVLIDKAWYRPDDFLRSLRRVYEDDRYALYEVIR
jgi:hypothetical protein